MPLIRSFLYFLLAGVAFQAPSTDAMLRFELIRSILRNPSFSQMLRLQEPASSFRSVGAHYDEVLGHMVSATRASSAYRGDWRRAARLASGGLSELLQRGGNIEPLLTTPNLHQLRETDIADVMVRASWRLDQARRDLFAITGAEQLSDLSETHRALLYWLAHRSLDLSLARAETVPRGASLFYRDLPRSRSGLLQRMSGRRRATSAVEHLDFDRALLTISGRQDRGDTRLYGANGRLIPGQSRLYSFFASLMQRHHAVTYASLFRGVPHEVYVGEAVEGVRPFMVRLLGNPPERLRTGIELKFPHTQRGSRDFSFDVQIDIQQFTRFIGEIEDHEELSDAKIREAIWVLRNTLSQALDDAHLVATSNHGNGLDTSSMGHSLEVQWAAFARISGPRYQGEPVELGLRHLHDVDLSARLVNRWLDYIRPIPERAPREPVFFPDFD
jgi:hypothetical protein